MWKSFLITTVLLCTGGTIFAQKPTVLYLGDSCSLSGFGQTVEATLRRDGVEVFAVVDRGAGPYHWLKEYQQFQSDAEYWEKTGTNERHVFSVRTVPKIDGLLREANPTVVVVQAGTSLYGILRSKRRNPEANLLEVRNLVELMAREITASGARLYWILPPHTHERLHPAELQNRLATIIKSIVESNGGRVFDSKRVTRYSAPYPVNDGITYTEEQSTDWARQVCPDLLNFIGGDRPGYRQPFTPLTKIETTNAIPVSLTPLTEVTTPASR